MSVIQWNCTVYLIQYRDWLVSSFNAVTVYLLDCLCSIPRRFGLLSPPGSEILQSGERPVPRALHSETKWPQRQFGFLVISSAENENACWFTVTASHVFIM